MFITFSGGYTCFYGMLWCVDMKLQQQLSVGALICVVLRIEAENLRLLFWNSEGFS